MNPYPWFYSGEPSSEIRERWQWTFPILFSPLDPHTLYTSSQRLWSTTDGGKNWTALSGDLTRHDPSTMGPSGGRITHDMNGPEVYATIFSVGPGKVDMDVIWTGSDDGLIHVTRDGGDHLDRRHAARHARLRAGEPDRRVGLRRRYGVRGGKETPPGRQGTLHLRHSRLRQELDERRERDSGRRLRPRGPGGSERQGLLYAGTQHGVYISYDDAAQWQPLDPNFPDIPVVDLVVEKNELVMASHGRGFWVLDNIAPLRQLTPETTASDVVLFTPPTALRSGPGVTLSWWLVNGADEARLEILDGSGAVLRTFEASPREEPGGQGGGGYGGVGGGAASLPDEPGLNHITWDLRTEGYVTFPGMIFWGARSQGPAVPPGQYTLRLTADGETATAPLKVERNPLITDVTDADLHAQYEFSVRVRDKVTEANEAVIAIRRVKDQLEDRYGRSDDARLGELGRRLGTDLSAVEENIYQVRNQSGQDPLNFPIKVNNRLANLLAMNERGDGRPGNMMPEIFDILVTELKGYTDRLEQIWSTELPAVNAELRRLNLAPLDPGCGRPEGCVVG